MIIRREQVISNIDLKLRYQLRFFQDMNIIIKNIKKLIINH